MQRKKEGLFISLFGKNRRVVSFGDAGEQREQKFLSEAAEKADKTLTTVLPFSTKLVLCEVEDECPPVPQSYD